MKQKTIKQFSSFDELPYLALIDHACCSVYPLQRGQAGFVVELQVVQDGASVSGLCDESEVFHELGKAGQRAHGGAAKHQINHGCINAGQGSSVRRLDDH